MHILHLVTGLALAAATVANAAAQAKPASQATPGFSTQTLTKGLEHPWGLAFIDGGSFLVTERPGRLRLIPKEGGAGTEVSGLPRVDARGQGGLLDIAADSDFVRNRTIYLCFSEPAASARGNSTALASARLSADGKQLEQLRVLFSQRPKFESSAHFGCRIVESPDGTLFLTLGDRYSRMQDAQTLDNHHGKIVRIRKDGSVPPDNPFAARAAQGVLPEIWSYGHRNLQGATWGPDGRLWTHEHGAEGGDEINTPQAGKNYGWPVITHGRNYGGAPIGAGITAQAGMEQPLHHWTPSIAPSGMTFLRSARYGKEWQGNLFVGSLKNRFLGRLVIDNGKVVDQERLLEELRQRIRQVQEGPDGLLYVLTDERNGQLLRLMPK